MTPPGGRRWWAAAATVAVAALVAWALARGRRSALRAERRPNLRRPVPSSGPLPLGEGRVRASPPEPPSPGLGQPWQWASGLLLASAIALSWWLLQGGVSRRLPTPVVDRRAAVDTAVAVPGRATRLAV